MDVKGDTVKNRRHSIIGFASLSGNGNAEVCQYNFYYPASLVYLVIKTGLP
jgi:hypothetical protein